MWTFTGKLANEMKEGKMGRKKRTERNYLMINDLIQKFLNFMLKEIITKSNF